MELHRFGASNTPTFRASGGNKKRKLESLPTPQIQGLSRFEIAWEPGFVVLVWFSALLPKQIIQPGTVGLQLLVTAAIHQSEVQPSRGVSNSSDLITDVRPRVLAHLLVEVGVGK